jgi:hypothetical protein
LSLSLSLLSIDLSIYPSIHLSIYPSIHLSIYYLSLAISLARSLTRLQVVVTGAKSAYVEEQQAPPRQGSKPSPRPGDAASSASGALSPRAADAAAAAGGPSTTGADAQQESRLRSHTAGAKGVPAKGPVAAKSPRPGVPAVPAAAAAATKQPPVNAVQFNHISEMRRARKEEQQLRGRALPPGPPLPGGAALSVPAAATSGQGQAPTFGASAAAVGGVPITPPGSNNTTSVLQSTSLLQMQLDRAKADLQRKDEELIRERDRAEQAEKRRVSAVLTVWTAVCPTPHVCFAGLCE